MEREGQEGRMRQILDWRGLELGLDQIRVELGICAAEPLRIATFG